MKFTLVHNCDFTVEDNDTGDPFCQYAPVWTADRYEQDIGFEFASAMAERFFRG